MKTLLAALILLLSLLHPAHAQSTDAAALRAAHAAYFGGFPNDRTAILKLGQKGNLFAAMMLERTWQRESYGPVSTEEAGRWRDAALAGNLPARLQALAERGDATAMTWLGSMHCYALLGVPEDRAQAAIWYGKGAEKGNAVAQRLFADMLFNGWGTEKDQVEAFHWYRKAADQGDPIAQQDLGRAYWFGNGVDQDKAQAISWLRKAAEQGNAGAQSHLGFAYRKGEGVARDDAQSLIWYRKAAGQGDAFAQYNLGVMYWNGNGVPKDEAQATEFFRKAADQGDGDALAMLGSIHYQNKDICAAIGAWERAAPLRSDGNTHVNLAKLYWNYGDLASARQSVLLARQKGGITEDDFTRKVLERTDRLERASPWQLQLEQDFPKLRNVGIEQRSASVRAFLSRIDNRMYVEDGGGLWSDDKLFLGYNNYTHCDASGHFFTRGNVVGDEYPGSEFGYRLDPETGVYRSVTSVADMLVESFVFLDPGTDGILTAGYTVNKRGKRSMVGSSVQSLQADGRLKVTSYGPFDKNGKTTLHSPVDRSRLPALVEAVRKSEADRKQAKQGEKQERSGLFRSLVGAAVGATMVGAAGADTDAVLGAALKGAQIFNSDSAVAASLGATGDALLGAGSATSATASGLAGASGGSYPTRPNLAASACAGFTEGNYRQKALSGGGDQQLHTMCGQAFDYYAMYKRAIAQGYSEADANRTYAAHEQSARVAQGFLRSHGAD